MLLKIHVDKNYAWSIVSIYKYNKIILIGLEIIFQDNGTKVDLTKDNYIDLLTKLIRANYDGIQTAKSIRAILGYGGNGFPADRYVL